MGSADVPRGTPKSSQSRQRPRPRPTTPKAPLRGRPSTHPIDAMPRNHHQERNMLEWPDCPITVFQEAKEDPGTRPGPPDDVHRVGNERQCSGPSPYPKRWILRRKQCHIPITDSLLQTWTVRSLRTTSKPSIRFSRHFPSSGSADCARPARSLRIPVAVGMLRRSSAPRSRKAV